MVGSDLLHGPDLIELEVLQVIRRLARAERISGAQAEEAVRSLRETRLVHWPHSALRDRVWSLRHNLSAYDASYVALADLLPDSILVTGDRALADVGVRQLGANRVRRL
jgi:predicted nucleic acid-binding protein